MTPEKLAATPEKVAMPKATPIKRKKEGVLPVNVTDWVSVHLNKRRLQDRNLAKTPCVVSSVDLEHGTANVLYPNHVSAFFNRFSSENRLLFAIKTYPLANVRLWE